MKRTREPHHSQQIPAEGLTTIVAPDTSTLDVVFVHGFTGHPERTWAHKRGNPNQHVQLDGEALQSRDKIRKTNFLPSFRGHKSHEGVYWLRDLIPSTLPHAWVLAYGYDTHIRHKTGYPISKSSVYDIAWDFIVALEAARRSEPRRPLIFVAHSLGGVVVKEALRRSSTRHLDSTHLRSVFDATVGIIFFGTPHGGADPGGVLFNIAVKAVKAAGFSVNEDIIRTLLPSSERLKELRVEFGSIVQEQKWLIHSFQEQYGISFLSNSKVVEDGSSCLNLPVAVEITEHIARDHKEMCRFTGCDDTEYLKVARALERIADVDPNLTFSGGQPYLSEDDKLRLRKSLKFDQIDARQHNIKAAHAKTCKWLLRSAQFQEWLDIAKGASHGRFLWIKGKPGAGKSTLMKFAFAHMKRSREYSVVSFFFNARGEGMEKCTLGMYQSILLQILECFPQLNAIFDTLSSSQMNHCTTHQWTIEILKELLELAIRGLKDPVICFIDALDECNESQVRDMVSFFEQISELSISNEIKFYTCFSSRHYPHITISKGLNLILEGEKGHSQDIINYIEKELKIGHSKVAEQIRKEVDEKASGVFMWVVLVVEILNKEHDSGRIHALRRRLQEIPGNLHELFRDILTRDSRNRDELILCVQFVLFAIRPLCSIELYFGIISGTEPQALFKWDPSDIEETDVNRFILSSSKGLVEITQGRAPMAQFIHESVKDFLLKDNGLSQIWPDLKENFIGQSHDRLKQCCFNYISSDAVSQLDLSDYSDTYSEQTRNLPQNACASFPFLEYATNSVLHHADSAERQCVAQADFLETFDLPSWIKFDNLFENAIRRHKPNVSLLYILAEKNLANLTKHCPSILLSLDVELERYGPPLFASFACGSYDVTRIFLKAYGAGNYSADELEALCDQYCTNEYGRTKFGRTFNFPHSKSRSVLVHFTKPTDEALFKLIIRSGKFNDAASVLAGSGLLHSTLNDENEGLAKFLLENHLINESDINTYKANRTPLMLAALRGYIAVVQLLLKTDKVDINYKSYSGQTALSLALGAGSEAVVKLLVETGKVNLKWRNTQGETYLSLAFASGNAAIVKLLIEEYERECKYKDSANRTLLHLATRYPNWTAMVKLLLTVDQIEIDSIDAYGVTPLLGAAAVGNAEVVKLLLETGKADLNYTTARGQ